ncbi:hypothetical protein BX661DRAFT_30543 [Kickxella alabastrina]|uniref:uncharacterized protein n=1 Tax=Kickxella alabastrina TaxID=61397 RepID=UPI00222047BD|nr:uncharacterized protein BX661DRAFT_30543 [Kickxella alabastrina]KAI7826792.1 hypothetical protein BX661DRAFT_30543 [Kickxella alabastrina]
MLADCLHGSAALRDQIDLLAIETIPSAAEASAVADALEALHGRGTRLPPAWISFTSSTADRIGCGDTIEDAVKAISNCPRVCAIASTASHWALLAGCWLGSSAQRKSQLSVILTASRGRTLTAAGTQTAAWFQQLILPARRPSGSAVV